MISKLLWLPLFFILFLVLEGCASGQEPPRDQLMNWPAWRGPLATGEAPFGHPPNAWSEDNNIRWKVDLPGKGHSTPIIWGEHIFVTTAVPFGKPFEPKYSGAPGAHDNVPVRRKHRFVMLAINREDGSIRWSRELHEAVPHEGGHRSASLASASPVTDGERVYAFFGSFGLYCLNFSGEILWEKDLGQMSTKHGHGEGASPVLHDDRIVVNWDHEGQSFLVAFDSITGEQLWRVTRDEVTSWATPIVVEHGGRDQVIVPGTDRVRAYDLSNGTVIWECGGLSANIVASPVALDNFVFLGSSYGTRAFMAIDLKGAHGDITGTDQVAWKRIRLTPYVPSPLVYEDAIYYLRHYQGIMSRVDPQTGEDAPGAFRLSGVGNVYASPVAADGRVFVTSREGNTAVFTSGMQPELIAVNRLDDVFSASPAIVGDAIYLRGEEYFYCIAAED